MNALDDRKKFVWWVKRTISNAVVKSRSREHVHDVYEAAQAQFNKDLAVFQGRIEMDAAQVQALESYIYRTVGRREKISAGTPNNLEAIEAQEKDDEELVTALAPDWMDLV